MAKSFFKSEFFISTAVALAIAGGGAAVVVVPMLMAPSRVATIAPAQQQAAASAQQEMREATPSEIESTRKICQSIQLENCEATLFFVGGNKAAGYELTDEQIHALCYKMRGEFKKDDFGARLGARCASYLVGVPPKGRWFAHDLNHSVCIESESPADRIREIQSYGVIAKSRDLPGGAVEVSEPINSRQERVRTYYPSMSTCEASLPQSQAVPSRYE
ncbi:MAG: hypothetical protein FWG56_11350 [Desulfovibrionaceae bacterium]|nr:hypothetical protein [Desulfovibrionaceae bacterium]